MAIKIEDLPMLNELTQEQLKELFGAGRFRPQMEALEGREMMAANLVAALKAPVAQAAKIHVNLVQQPAAPALTQTAEAGKDLTPNQQYLTDKIADKLPPGGPGAATRQDPRQVIIDFLGSSTDTAAKFSEWKKGKLRDLSAEFERQTGRSMEVTDLYAMLGVTDHYANRGSRLDSRLLDSGLPAVQTGGQGKTGSIHDKSMVSQENVGGVTTGPVVYDVDDGLAMKKADPKPESGWATKLYQFYKELGEPAAATVSSIPPGTLKQIELGAQSGEQPKAEESKKPDDKQQPGETYLQWAVRTTEAEAKKAEEKKQAEAKKNEEEAKKKEDEAKKKDAGRPAGPDAEGRPTSADLAMRQWLIKQSGYSPGSNSGDIDWGEHAVADLNAAVDTNKVAKLLLGPDFKAKELTSTEVTQPPRQGQVTDPTDNATTTPQPGPYQETPPVGGGVKQSGPSTPASTSTSSEAVKKVPAKKTTAAANVVAAAANANVQKKKK